MNTRARQVNIDRAASHTNLVVRESELLMRRHAPDLLVTCRARSVLARGRLVVMECKGVAEQ
jgi:hypothetical protein